MDTKPCEVSLALEIDSSEVKKETDTVFNQIQQQAKIDGFRPGKAPLALVKKQYQEHARKEVMQNLMSRIIPEALKEQKINAISYPMVEKYDFDFGKTFSLQVKVEKSPDIKVKNYKKIKIQKKIYAVDDKQIKEQLDQLRDKYAHFENDEGAAATKEHYVVVDYNGTVDGKQVPGSAAKNQMLYLGSSQMIQGFSEGLQGAKAGDEKILEIQFPETHPQKEFANKKAQFTVTVREVKKKVVPPLDDEFAKDIGLESLAVLHARLKSELLRNAEHKTEDEVRSQLINGLLEANQFPVPSSLVEERLKTLLERAQRTYVQQGHPAAEWEKHKNEFASHMKPEAEKQVRTSYIFNAIAAIEKTIVTDEDLKAEMDNMILHDAAQEKAIRQYYSTYKDDILLKLKEEKLFKFLLDNAKINLLK
jgi:trigger factor